VRAIPDVLALAGYQMVRKDRLEPAGRPRSLHEPRVIHTERVGEIVR
jgi:hypothetical protein